MAGSRSKANQALYRAKILLRGWELAVDGQQFPAPAVDEAYRPAVRQALKDTYGWFLLAVAGVDDAPASELPMSCDALPSPAQGRARAPELQEFSLLERDGWLAELLQEDAGEHRVSSSVGLLGSDRQAHGRAVFVRWTEQLQAIMNRMDDSLSEY